MLNYFPHPSNLRVQPEFLNVRRLYDAAGYGIALMVLELLRDAESQKMDITAEALAFSINEPDAELVRSIIRTPPLFEYTEDGLLHSPWLDAAIQSYHDAKAAAQEAGRRGAQKRWAKAKGMQIDPNSTPLEPNATNEDPTTNKSNNINKTNEINKTNSKLLDLSWGKWDGASLVALCRQTSLPLTEVDIENARIHNDDKHNPAYVVEIAYELGLAFDQVEFLMDWTKNGTIGSPEMMYLIKLYRYLISGQFKPKYMAEYVIHSCLTNRNF